MDKKSVILFVSFLFMLGVVFVMADVGTVTLLKFGDGYEVSGWTKGGAPTTFNITVPVTNSENITNITIYLDTSNYTWMFVSLNGAEEVDASGAAANNVMNVSYLANGSLADWNCTNITLTTISCYNNTDEASLSAGVSEYSSLTILINVTGETTSESTGINWTVMTAGPGFEPDTTNNASTFTTGNDALVPRLMDLNISDGRGQTYYNGTNMSGGDVGFWIDGTGTVTVAGTIVDANLATKAYLYCSGNTTLANEGSPSVATTAESITAVTLSGTTALFTTTVPATCLKDGNVTSFIVVANDSFNQFVDFNESAGATVPFQINVNSTKNPKLGFVNLTQTFTDSDGSLNTVTKSSTSGLTGGVYIGARNTTFWVELANEDKRDQVSLIYRNESTLFVEYGNGSIFNGNGTLTMQNQSAVNDSSATTTVFEISLDFTGDGSNTSYEFYIVSSNADVNYTTQVGPFRFEIDTVAPNEPTMTMPDDRTINPRGSITYTCESSDSFSGVTKMKWKLTKPDGTTLTTSYGDVSNDKQSYTFTGDDTMSLGTYSIECISMDVVGNTASHASTSTQNFQVLSSSVGGSEGGDGGAAGAPTFDLDFSTSEQANLKVPQGTIKTFTFDGATEHTITFSEVTATTVTLNIASTTPVVVTLVVGESKNVDLNADGVNDLVVKLNGIVNDKADVTISKIKEGAELIVKQEQQPPAPTPGQQPPAGQEQPPAEVEGEGSSAWIWITLIIIIAVVVVGYFLLKKKKQ